MQYYRIYITNKTWSNIFKSPFVFTKEDSIRRCKALNKYFPNGIHLYRPAKRFIREEIRGVHSEDASFRELLEIIRSLDL